MHREPPSQGGRVCKTLCVHNNRASSLSDAGAQRRTLRVALDQSLGRRPDVAIWPHLQE
ncbi:hypothetical protein EMIT0194P_20369 [Pseudomonas serbica]